MNGLSAQIFTWLNAAANTLGLLLLAPVGMVPGWLSATLVAVVSGAALLLVFKYTSNQRAIKRARDDISAQLLALKLFKENPWVAVRAQYRILFGAGKLAIQGIVPMLVMMVPVCLILGQLGMWYQFTPLPVGEEAILTVKLAPEAVARIAEVRLDLPDGVENALGPVCVPSKFAVYWNIRGRKNGYYQATVTLGGQSVNKEVAVGDGYMRVSAQRPEMSLVEVMLHPSEAPLARDFPIRSIEIDYPTRDSKVSGTDWWVIYWLIVSMVAGFAFRRPLNVNV